MEGKVIKDTWNMIRQISITGRRSWKTLKVFPILPCPEALSSDQAANLLGERQNCILFSPRVTQEKQVVLCQSGQTSRKKAALQICSHRKRSQQTTFPSATGFQRNSSQDSKMKKTCFHPVTKSGCLWLNSTGASSLSPTKFLLSALVLWTLITLHCLKINARQTGDGRNKTLCGISPVVERSGSKGEGAEEFHWFNFFLAYIIDLKKYHCTILSHKRHKLAWI